MSPPPSAARLCSRHGASSTQEARATLHPCVPRHVDRAESTGKKTTAAFGCERGRGKRSKIKVFSVGPCGSRVQCWPSQQNRGGRCRIGSHELGLDRIGDQSWGSGLSDRQSENSEEDGTMNNKHPWRVVPGDALVGHARNISGKRHCLLLPQVTLT